MIRSTWLVDSSGRLAASWRLLIFIAILFVVSAPIWVVFGPLLGAVFRAVGIQTGPESIVLLTGATLAHLVMLRWVDRGDWDSVALGPQSRRARPIVWSFALAAVAILLPTLVLLFAGLLALMPDPFGGWRLLTERALLVLVPAAMWEELLSRGYLFSVLVSWRGPAVALAVTSIAFGMLHWMNPHATLASILVVVLAGIFLGAVRLRTQSLWAAFAAHFGWNAMLVLVLHAVLSGDRSFATPGWRLVNAGPAWLTGGSWGPEGGVAAAMGLVGAILLVARRPGAIDESNGSSALVNDGATT